MPAQFSIDDALALVHRADPAWNDDGSRIGYRRHEAGDWTFAATPAPMVETTDVSMAASDEFSETVTDLAGVSEFAWRPEHPNEAVIVADGHLYRVDAASGKCRPFSSGSGDHGGVRWNSGGTTLAYRYDDRLWAHDVGADDAAPFEFDRPVADQFHGTPMAWDPAGERVATLFVTSADNLGVVVFDASSMAAVWTYAPSDGHVPSFEWVADDHLVYVEDNLNGTKRAYRSVLLGEDDDRGVPILTETSTRVLARVEADPVSNERGTLAVLSGRTGYHNVYLVDVAARRAAVASARPGFDGAGVVQLTDGPFEARADSRDVPAWSADGTHLAYVTNERDPGERHLHVAEINGIERGETTVFDDVNGTAAQATWGPDDRIAFVRAGRLTPPDIHVASVEHEAIRRVTSGHPRPSAFETLTEPEPVAFESADGLTVHGYLYAPDRENAPTVVMCHGGPHTQMRRGFNHRKSYSMYHAFDQCLVSRGYAVLELNYRGSVGYGREYEGAHHFSVGESNVGDCVAAAEYIRAREDLGDRVGLWGISYGGYLANAVAAKTNALDCSINFAGIWDWREWIRDAQERHWFAGRRRFMARFGGPPDSDDPAVVERYRVGSPCEYAADLDTPLFAFHGQADPNVPFDQLEALVADLVAAEKDFEAMFYPDEDHFFRWPSTWRDVFRRVLPFFDEHLETDR